MENPSYSSSKHVKDATMVKVSDQGLLSADVPVVHFFMLTLKDIYASAN